MNPQRVRLWPSGVERTWGNPLRYEGSTGYKCARPLPDRNEAATDLARRSEMETQGRVRLPVVRTTPFWQLKKSFLLKALARSYHSSVAPSLGRMSAYRWPAGVEIKPMQWHYWAVSDLTLRLSLPGLSFVPKSCGNTHSDFCPQFASTGRAIGSRFRVGKWNVWTTIDRPGSLGDGHRGANWHFDNCDSERDERGCQRHFRPDRSGPQRSVHTAWL